MATVASSSPPSIAADALALPAAIRSLMLPMLALAVFLVAWLVATVVWGFNGFIGGADAAVLGMFGILLGLTRQ